MHGWKAIVGLWLFSWLLPSGTGECRAEPFVPTDEALVLEQLREKPLDPRWQELRRLRAEHRQRPGDLDAAIRLATRYIEQSRIDSDPRRLGHAQAVLSRWLAQESPPSRVLLLRATIRQSLHDFDGALADLERVTRANSRDSQAWLTGAVIHQVQGRYAEARRHCARLVRLAGELISTVCLAATGGLDGHASASYELLASALARAGTFSATERQWAETLLAEMAERRGDAAAADAHYNSALAAGPRDLYLLAVYADFLLDHDRSRDVVALLRGERKADPLLLRLALAEQQLGLQEAAADREALSARFDAGRRRGDRVHQREEARFRLALMEEPGEALRLANANWTVQREPADARVLLEAALAAGMPGAARPVVDWFRSNHVEDVRLEGLIRLVERDAS